MIFHAHIFSVLSKNSPFWRIRAQRNCDEFWVLIISLSDITHPKKGHIHMIILCIISSLSAQMWRNWKTMQHNFNKPKKCVMLSTIYPVTNFKKCSNKDTLFTLKKANEKSKIGKRKLALSVFKSFASTRLRYIYTICSVKNTVFFLS